ncbi:MAG: hypothetical protein H6837_06915, partial [Planctomycetes bacterium]|nr:hypothetical protein [Planctomycetota bacterium]
SLAQDPGTSYHVRVDEPIGPGMHALLLSRYDAGCGPRVTGAPIEMYLQPEEYGQVLALGVKLKVLGRGRPFAEIATENAKTQLLPDTNYYTSAEVVAEIDALVTAFPAIARKVEISALPGAAKTHENRSIWALKISDNVGTDEDEPAVVIAAQHHARELNSTVMVIEAMKKIVTGYATDPQLKALVDGYEIYCVPCVNPDGTDYVWSSDNNWRKNRRNNGSNYGVDNNRNYPFLWTSTCSGSTSTSSETYRGPSAGSEPENQTMMALSRLLRPEIYLDFHSSGREVLSTYAPCATVNSTIAALIQRYQDSLRTPMSYAARLPSAGGEAPEFHWADGGTMSFLTEVMTSFQPAYSQALTEAARVWPGIQTALTTWQPAVRGHVRSIFQSQGVAATIRYTPNLFAYNEQAASRARDGRYALWLPLGTYQVTFSAPGFASVTKTVVVTSYDAPQALEIDMVPTMTPATLTKTGSDRLGTTTTLTYTSTGDAGERYWVLLSLGTVPGIPLGAGRTLPLNPDAALFASLPPSPLLSNQFGTLPASGVAQALFAIPNIPQFSGLTVYAGGLTENAMYLGYVKNFSSSLAIRINP